MAEQSYTPPAAPPQTPGFPQNPAPIVYQGFTGLNTKASQPGIGDQEMYVCDGLMPLGPNNLRILRDLGSAIYTAPGSLTIMDFGFANISSLPICVVILSDGSMVQVNMNTFATTTIASAGTITDFDTAISQWSSQYAMIVSQQTNGYFLWNGSVLFKAGGVAPDVEILSGGEDYASAPTITAVSQGAQATGYIEFGVNPSPGDTITLNGVTYTYIAGASSGTNIHIEGTVEFTTVQTEVILNASVNPSISVATYFADTAGPVRLEITYDTTGTAGNAYTLAASAATPSGATLTGGIDGGGGATFTGTVSDGALVGVTVTNPGTGYVVGDYIPLTTSGGGSDDQASATATISTDSGVASVNIINPGYGYSELVRVTASGGGASTQATFSVVGQSGVITAVNVENPGIGYTSVPTLTVTDLATGAVGSGASLTAVLQSGQISGTTILGGGTNYTSPPTITVLGDGSGAILQANISASVLDSITIVNAGTNYTKAFLLFTGGNKSATALASIMPFGISGTTVETYQSRVWTGDGRTGKYSSPGSPTNFDAADGAGAFESNDSFLKVAYKRFIQSNGFLYLTGDSSVNYISGVSTSGNPAITTFNNLNVDPQIGSPWPKTVQAFGRDIVFANSVGVHVSYGGAVTKVSDALDGIYSSVPQEDWPAGFEPSAAIATIFGIKVYILMMCIIDQVTSSQVIKCLMWDGKKWWTSPQTGFTNGFIATQEIDSVLKAYCTPDNLTINQMFTTPTTASTMTKYLYSKLWDTPGVFTTKQIRQWFAVVNIVQGSLPGAASGYIEFAVNPSPGDTITLNGVVWTFVAGAPGANQTQIQGTVEFTIFTLQENLNASTNVALTVASYSQTTPPTRINILYNTSGTVGNAYTLAASAATPSGATLSGGTDPPKIYLAAVTENGIDTEAEFEISRTGPTVIGPLSASGWGRLIGVRLRTNTEDAQINSLTLFNNLQQTDY